MSTAQHEIVLEPGNPQDFTEEELQALAENIRDQMPGITPRIVVREERGYGVTWAEVIHIYSMAKDVAANLAFWSGVLAPVVLWARARWKKDRELHPEATPRPRIVTLYGPDGTPLKQIRVAHPDGATTEEEVDPSERRPPLS